MNANNKAVIVFKFTSYKFEPLKKRVIFNYKIEFSDRQPLSFAEAVILPKIPNIDALPNILLHKLLEGLHIILGISYYKLYCATKVALPYKLTKQEADFWNTIYKNGLGEFFYKNNLDPEISPQFPFKENHKPEPISCKLKAKSLVGVGGGKDSIVALELLKANDFDFDLFFVQTGEKSEIANKIAKLADKNKLTIKRILDKKIFDGHPYGGHIPISAVYAFLGVFSAALYGYSNFIVGNEYSSNFGNLKYKGLTINHQWSKSFEFESLFQGYLKNFVTTDVRYFSLLRPFYEIRIVKMFSKFKKYLPFFSSCNQNFKIHRIKWHAGNAKRSFAGWCGECPKCVFVFTLLSAFLSRKELLKIFGRNLYQDKNLLPLFKDIMGFGKTKPFDCVGTFQEAQTALFIAKNTYKNDFVMQRLGDKAKYHKEVFKAQKQSAIPEQFKFLGQDNVLILGYGKEGQATKKYLHRYFPNLKVGIADIKRENNYLDKQKNFDIAVKTPGIKKELLHISYTTATNMFFSKVKGKNLIIGITGSKGKSTTTSLIYEILKTAGKPAELLGNIGKPMLERLLRPVKKGTIFVLELSSFQLDDIKFSPDISVVTNLFPEHMDYHGTIKNYYVAKKNIINFQSKDNFFVYNPKNKIVGDWLKDCLGKAVPFDDKIRFETKLIGKHNAQNIKAAISVAKILQIPEKIILKAVKNFSSLPHRLEFVGKFNSIKFYDDAISTTPESTIMAIESLKNIDTIFLGGEDRGYDFSKLEKIVKKYKIRNVVLFPDSGGRILKSKKDFNILETAKMEEAVRFAYENTKKGRICLLSCASPSYSVWKNFEEKGNQFKRYVRKLKNLKT